MMFFRIARHQKWLPAAALIAIVLIAYAPVYPAGFIWDDPDYVINNQTLRSLAGLWHIWTVPTSLPQWYPLVHTTFWLEYQLWGVHPLGYHIDNVLIHAAGVVLLWRLLADLEIPGAWLAAAIFAVHPIHVESVAWITERKNTLSALLYFAAAIAYLRSQPTLFVVSSSFLPWHPRGGSGRGRSAPQITLPTLSTQQWYLTSIALFTGALFSKTVACSLPVAILLIQYWKQGRIHWREVIRLLPMFAIGLVLALTTAWLERTHVKAIGVPWTFANTSAGEFIARTLIAGRGLWFYAAKLAVPWPLAFIYSRWHIDLHSPWQFAFPIAAVGVLIALWLLRHRLGRGPLMGVLYFAITLFPALGFFNIYPMRFSFVADHFQHLASLGLTTLAAVALANCTARWPRTGIAIGSLLLLTLASFTFYQCTIYHDAETLWRDTMKKTPGSWMVYTNLGRVLEAQGRAVQAVPYHEIAVRLAPELPDTHENIAVGRMLQGRFDEAEIEFHRALAIDPHFVPALTDLGKLEYFDRHDSSLAEQYFLRALQVSPTFAPANYAFGVLLEQQGKLADAAEHYRTAAQDFPDDFDTEYDLGSILLKLHRPDEAIAPLKLATRLDPKSLRAWTNLRAAYLMSDQPAAAAQSVIDSLKAMGRSTQ